MRMSRQAVDRRDVGRGSGGEHHGQAGLQPPQVPVGVFDVDPALAGEPAPAPHQHATGAVEPLHLVGVVPVVDDLVPAGERRVDVELDP